MDAEYARQRAVSAAIDAKLREMAFDVIPGLREDAEAISLLIAVALATEGAVTV
jgi:hypothetical protein